MRRILDIDRMNMTDAKPYRQRIVYESEDERDTVATALRKISESDTYRDEDGGIVEPVEWECSCLQKKCGACAMVIDGRPMLACATKLVELPDEISIEPLRKFKRIADLRVDRSQMREALKTLKIWLDDEVIPDTTCEEELYDGSKCLQCGLCLEVCPNYYSEGKFYGMAGMVPDSRVLIESDKKHRKPVKKEYNKHIYEGCGKSLACRDICPAGIDIERLLVKSNRLGIWR